MNTKGQLFCLYTGYGFFPIYLLGFAILSGFIPIIPPSWDALQITAYFEQNQFSILIGQILCVIASALLVPWAVAIFTQMIRLEQGSRAISYFQLGCGIIGVVFFMVPSFTWATMAFRTGIDPNIMLFANDFAWIAWAISWPPFAMQAVAISLIVLLYKKEQDIFPRWAAFTSLWLGVAMVPASCVVFFKTGPFAWNGLIAVYLPLVIYTIWWHVIFFATRNAIKGQASIEASAPSMTASHA